jgi:hypothetical protein
MTNLVRILNMPEDRLSKRIGLQSELEFGDDIEISATAAGLTIRWEGEDSEAKAQVFRLDLDVRNTERLEKALAERRRGA